MILAQNDHLAKEVARCPVRVKSGNSHCEQMLSALAR
jgi:hypothetical protein